MTRVRLLNRAAWNRIESIIVAWVGNRGVRLRRTAGCCEHVTTGGNEHAFDKTSSTKADLQGAAGRCVYALAPFGAHAVQEKRLPITET